MTDHPNRSAESCDLIERLRNPMWAHGNVPFLSPQLEQEENLAAMNEAAAEIERLRDKLSFAEFEWNRATAGMKKRDAKIASLTGAPAQGVALRDAAERVCWFDWSDNDRDAAAAVDELRRVLASQPSPAATVETSQFETTKAGVIDWKMEAERANRLLAQAERPKCRLCGLEDGACICAHLPPRLSAGSDAANALAKRLHHAAVTMQNDDISEPQSEKRRRHIERYETLIDAVDYLSAQPQPAPVTETAGIEEIIDLIRGEFPLTKDHASARRLGCAIRDRYTVVRR
jgi:hypothetical protein